jgi:hypothetical protein
MDDAKLYDEAETCRQKALSYLGKPEASFLLRVARGFERLATERRKVPEDPSD